jgi:hypothetical protein
LGKAENRVVVGNRRDYSRGTDPRAELIGGTQESLLPNGDYSP